MYEVIIIGAGHAGCEAAMAAARQKVKTLLININMDSIASMPCNSAIGGPGRGQMVREIDVLGGEMARNTDRTFIHMRMLNTSKGPAVRTLRAIVDKKRYFLEMKKVLENQENLHLRQALTTQIMKKDGHYLVRNSDNSQYETKTVVFCNGTFLRGKIFWGKNVIEAGRQGEITSNSLALSMEKLGIRFGRLKTDTPPRVDKKTINTQGLSLQHYDNEPQMFAYGNQFDGRKQIDNYITYARREAIDYIKSNIYLAPFINKEDRVEGPKYCPSIEEKVLRYPQKSRHLVFIQPEGLNTNEMYLHGLMTTFPENIQKGLLERIEGLENAVITRPGYGVEYDYLLSYQIKPSLESKELPGLFFAGQINGTTGYEEAAAQGCLAGINAGRYAQDREPIIISREDGYIGVLIDDMVTKGITQPYRMLTSRNEYRLYHRHDNADYRMIKYLKKLNQDKKAAKIENRYDKVFSLTEELSSSKYNLDQRFDAFYVKYGEQLTKKYKIGPMEVESAYIETKYKYYLDRQKNNMKMVQESLDIGIPDQINYDHINNISNEAQRSLKEKKPISLRQAKNMEGVSPADIFALLCYLKNVSRET